MGDLYSNQQEYDPISSKGGQNTFYPMVVANRWIGVVWWKFYDRNVFFHPFLHYIHVNVGNMPIVHQNDGPLGDLTTEIIEPSGEYLGSFSVLCCWQNPKSSDVQVFCQFLITFPQPRISESENKIS